MEFRNGALLLKVLTAVEYHKFNGNFVIASTAKRIPNRPLKDFHKVKVKK